MDSSPHPQSMAQTNKSGPLGAAGSGAMATQALRRLLAAPASAVIRCQSPCSSASAGTSQEPPTQTTLDSARNCAALSADTPPVGQNRTSPNGPCQALSMAVPPACTAGKKFSSFEPSFRETGRAHDLNPATQ